jgi:hypothetical protein
MTKTIGPKEAALREQREQRLNNAEKMAKTQLPLLAKIGGLKLKKKRNKA